MTKVLYIGGWGRSGSTVVSTLLGSIEGFVSVGEVRYLWDRGLQLGGACGCGESIADCRFWNDITTRLGSLDQIVSPSDMEKRVGSGAIYNQIFSQLFGPRRSAPIDSQPFEQLATLYRSIAEVSAANVIVDSSKVAPYAAIVNKLPDFELYFLHLIRDPRAVAFSWRRKKQGRDVKSSEYFPQYGPIRSALEWSFFNLLGDQLKGRLRTRFMRMRYEDFIADPQTATSRILEFIDEKKSAPEWVGPTEFRVRPQHAISGNHSRFAKGTLILRGDQEWRQKISPFDRAIVSTITAPLNLFYGYEIYST